MAKQEIAVTDEKYHNIFAYEKKIAQIITAQVVEKPELSAWMILIPIVFIPYLQRYQKYKELSQIFSTEYLFTKKIALEAAYKIYKQEISPAQGLTWIAKAVQKNPDAAEAVWNIYEKQIKEVELLCAHYTALFASGEDSYRQMVVGHYQTRDLYLGFVEQLARAEKEVSGAAAATFQDGAREVPDIMEKMEKHLLELRREEAKEFFSRG